MYLTSSAYRLHLQELVQATTSKHGGGAALSSLSSVDRFQMRLRVLMGD